MASRPSNEGQARPEVGDILVVIHDFQARSSDELTLAKGDKVELIERDDEFGDGWFLGRHVANGGSGLFPEVYTRPAPKTVSTSGFPTAKAAAPVVQPDPEPDADVTPNANENDRSSKVPSLATHKSEPPKGSLPLHASFMSTKSDAAAPQKSAPTAAAGVTSIGRLDTNQDHHVLSETLNVINEHITDLRSPQQGNGAQPNQATDSGSEYSTHLDHRASYIAGEETDEEDDGAHSRSEVLAWSCDEVAEYLFTAGVEKHHCEVFRDQEITGEVLLGMDQSSLFIKALDLGSVGRRLKTWQKIKSLQDEVSGLTKRSTLTYGSEVGSEDARRTRSRTSTLTSGGRVPTIDTKRLSQTPRMDPTSLNSPVSPRALQDSPTRPAHITRPSAASVRDLHHARRHSSNDFRLTGTTVTSSATPKLSSASSVFAPSEQAHKKQPSFDRNWTMGGAYSTSPRPLSSTGLHDILSQSQGEPSESAIDDRGYFSGTEVDGRKRNVLRKRESGAHSRKSSYADEQRVRSATAISRHSRYGSYDSARDPTASPAAAKYYGLQGGPHRRTASTTTTESLRPLPVSKDSPSPTVTRLDGSAGLRESQVTPVSPLSPANRQGIHADWLAALTKPSVKVPGGIRAMSETVSGPKSATPTDSSIKESPMQSPARTGSSTPSAGPSFELDSPDAAKSPSTTATAASRTSKKKTKKETSAYMRGLQKISPREAMADADYSGWMRKKSSNLMTTWKPRLFVLKGRRLAYYYSEDDDQEKGLIDISFHRVLPADNERITGIHATITGAGSSSGLSALPVSHFLPAADKSEPLGDKKDDSIFIFKLVPPRAGLSRAVNFTKPMVHYFAVPSLQQGRLWMAALMKATIDRDDTQVITTTYQQKTISLAKARQMRHRPPALMNLDELAEEEKRKAANEQSKKENNMLGISFGEADSGVSGVDKLAPLNSETTQSISRFLSMDAEKVGLEPKTA